MTRPHGRLVIASNRLPIVIDRDGPDWRVRPGSGGLITALAPVLKNRGGLWIGWPGTVDEEHADLDALLRDGSDQASYGLLPIHLTADQREKFYAGFANEIIWPLFHDLQTRCNFNPAFWTTYLEVNRQFARAIADAAHAGDFIWVHDYHLMNVAYELRPLLPAAQLGFFLHIPFPPLDIFVKLPWRFEILEALLQYDLIGFQTLRDRRNFFGCLRALFDRVHIDGKGHVASVEVNGRRLRVGSFPIGIDDREFTTQAALDDTNQILARLHADMTDRRVILGVDRLDYTKGVPQRLLAFQVMLQRHLELHRTVSLIQIIVPSREAVAGYAELKREIDRLVGEINGEFTLPGWVPIHYLFRALDQPELLAYYRRADVALITPLKDGMNLVAKEYCACQLDGNGVLILSEFAGAATQFHRDALLVNPYDVDRVADALIRALEMDLPQRQARMKRLRKIVREQNIYWWVTAFLRAAISRHLHDFPRLDDYVPRPAPPLPHPAP